MSEPFFAMIDADDPAPLVHALARCDPVHFVDRSASGS